MEKFNKRGCEEVGIQFIDGDDNLVRLAEAASIHQGDIAFWFEDLDDLDQTEATQIIFLLDCGYSLRDALERYEEVCLYDGSAVDYAYDLYFFMTPNREALERVFPLIPLQPVLPENQ